MNLISFLQLSPAKYLLIYTFTYLHDTEMQQWHNIQESLDSGRESSQLYDSGHWTFQVSRDIMSPLVNCSASAFISTRFRSSHCWVQKFITVKTEQKLEKHSMNIIRIDHSKLWIYAHMLICYFLLTVVKISLYNTNTGHL